MYAVSGPGYLLYLLLLGRSIMTGQQRSYPFFFSYVVFAFLSDAVLLVLLLLRFEHYVALNWVSYMVETLLWLAIAWEVFRKTFPRESALRPVAGGVLIGVLFLLALLLYLSGPQPGIYLKAEFVRKIALSIVVWVLVVLVLARYYRVPMGRNIRGMAVGLLVLASSHIVNFAAVEIFPSFTPIWSFLVPIMFVLTLLIWTVALWSYAPNPKPGAPGKYMHGETLSHWEQRWAALGMAIRKVIKQH